MPPRPVSLEYTRQRNRRKAKAYRDRIRRSRRMQSHHRQASESPNDLIAQVASIASVPNPTDQPVFPVDDKPATITTVATLSTRRLLPGETQYVSEQPSSHRQNQPPITRRRVQRHREKQHRLRIAAVTRLEENTTLSDSEDQNNDDLVYPDIPIGDTLVDSTGEGNPETHSNLRANVSQSSPRNSTTSITSESPLFLVPSVNEHSTPGSLQGSGSASSGGGQQVDSALNCFIQLLNAKATPRGSECLHPPELEEPQQVHTVRERVRHLQSSLPRLTTIFGETTSYDPAAFFPEWQQPLSFHKTQATLPSTSVSISRQWDIDSIWLGANDLQAIRPPNEFQLSFLPSMALNHATDQIAKTRHILLGTFSTLSIRFPVFVLFPKAARGPKSKTSASHNALSLQRQKDFYDQIIIPTVYEAISDPFRQEISQSYDMLYAKSRSFQEKPEDQSRAFRLQYPLPAKDLPLFWQSVVERANSVRISTQGGDNVAYFEDPQLLFQSHDLKNTFSHFQKTVLSALNPVHLDISSYHAATPALQDSSEAGPYTLLWKSQCNNRLHDQISRMVPESPMTATYFRSFLLRDASTYKSKAKKTGNSNPGHPNASRAGIIRAKAYDCNKELFAVMFSDYYMFGSGFLPLLAFNEEMIKELWSSSHNSHRVSTSQISRASLLSAWEANKRHLKAISDAKILANYGVRKEVTFPLDTILTMWGRGYFDPYLNPHISLAPDAAKHYPFWVVPTKDIKALILIQAARLILPLDYLFRQASVDRTEVVNAPGHGVSPARLVLSFYTAQLFCRLLIYTLSSEQQFPYDNWIWLTKWVRGLFLERQGLGLEKSIRASGMLWVPPDCINWYGGHIVLEKLIHLYIPRSPIQTRLASQANRLREAKGAFESGHLSEAEEIAGCNKVARMYHKHMLSKLQIYWERMRSRIGHSTLHPLDRLQQLLRESDVQTCRILYRTFKRLWNVIKEHAGSFDSRFSRIIGTYIMVAFNSDRSKEVGTNHTYGTWYDGRPTFFQVQFWAPYFSPPSGNLQYPWNHTKSSTTTTSNFHKDTLSFQQLWSQVMHQFDELRNENLENRNVICQWALRCLLNVAGPQWKLGSHLADVLPWEFSRQEGSGGECEDPFRVPMLVARTTYDIFHTKICRPTIILPTRDNIMALLDAIDLLPHLSQRVSERIQWARELLDNEGEQYSIRSRLEEKQIASELVSQPISLLELFLSQTEPPQRIVRDDGSSISEPELSAAETSDDNGEI
ncbi:hypothetical protein BKA56DRAFT_648243 [Ilyonectria sp. MPI-CAGE-AT-0026]|nr:hypothetical protein BKA56DRAFT_648243 [Ilyonectria sp. MPI-CAGE-AT-0026]